MSIPVPNCDFCGNPQKTLGAVLFGPPDANNKCEKLHCCVDCWPRLTVVLPPPVIVPKFPDDFAPKSTKAITHFLDDLADKQKLPDPEAAKILDEHLNELVGPEHVKAKFSVQTDVPCPACQGLVAEMKKNCEVCGGQGHLKILKTEKNGHGDGTG